VAIATTAMSNDRQRRLGEPIHSISRRWALFGIAALRAGSTGLVAAEGAAVDVESYFIRVTQLTSQPLLEVNVAFTVLQPLEFVDFEYPSPEPPELVAATSWTPPLPRPQSLEFTHDRDRLRVRLLGPRPVSAGEKCYVSIVCRLPVTGSGNGPRSALVADCEQLQFGGECFPHLGEAFDLATVSMEIVVPSGWIGVGIGDLSSITDRGMGECAYSWQTRSPIPTCESSFLLVRRARSALQDGDTVGGVGLDAEVLRAREQSFSRIRAWLRRAGWDAEMPQPTLLRLGRVDSVAWPRLTTWIADASNDLGVIDSMIAQAVRFPSLSVDITDVALVLGGRAFLADLLRAEMSGESRRDLVAEKRRMAVDLCPSDVAALRSHDLRGLTIPVSWIGARGALGLHCMGPSDEMIEFVRKLSTLARVGEGCLCRSARESLCRSSSDKGLEWENCLGSLGVPTLGISAVREGADMVMNWSLQWLGERPSRTQIAVMFRGYRDGARTDVQTVLEESSGRERLVGLGGCERIVVDPMFKFPGHISVSGQNIEVGE